MKKLYLERKRYFDKLYKKYNEIEEIEQMFIERKIKIKKYNYSLDSIVQNFA